MHEDLLGENIVKLLEEILRWTRFQGWRNVKDVLTEMLTDDLSKLIYHYSDGRSSREVAQRVPVSHVTVLRYWRKWARVGVVEPIKVSGRTRYRKMFELEDFGIEMPEIKKKVEKKLAKEV
ncbi:MAG: hypothetical protein DRG31_06045 [Deltaproteobacteria bacterium]|nr:MAG: hypothetical protein DRG31_06045 [Deltaproteobacteria bacterium]